jgi:hypothetical protein
MQKDLTPVTIRDVGRNLSQRKGILRVYIALDYYDGTKVTYITDDDEEFSGRFEQGKESE